jgi:RNA-dependent RNA polymerase
MTMKIVVNLKLILGTLKIEIRLKNISYVEIQSNEGFEKTVYFHFAHPPKIFRKINNNNKIKSEDYYVGKFFAILDKVDYTNHYHLEYKRTSKQGKTTLINENLFVEHMNSFADKTTKDIITNNDEVSFDVDNENEFLNYVRIDSYLSIKPEYLNFYLLNLVMMLKIKFRSEEEVRDFFTELKLNAISEESYEINLLPDEGTKREVDEFLRKKLRTYYTIFLNLHFNLQYSIVSLITQKKLNIFSFDTALLERLGKMNCEEQNEASLIIELMIKEWTKLNSQSDLLKIFNTYLEKSFQNELLRQDDKERHNKDVMKTRTIEVTPSMIIYKPPVYEKQNHILRKYGEYKDNFIKVNFVDEDGSKIYFSSQSMWILINFLKNVMLNGINVGSRIFEFLSASNSQMKNSSYWFFNLEGSRFLEIEQIIRELGDFSKETNIHKNAARRGQCLSTTSFVKKLDPSMIKKIDDVERNGYIFTDGIGMISLDLALECARAQKMDYASAFQIRLGGIKGIVAVNPDLKEKELICVRPSMSKFESQDTELGVIRGSTFSQGFLNRQIVTLLSTLGVPNDIFINMAYDDIQKLNKIIESPQNLLSKNFNKGDFLRKCYFFMPTLSHFCANNLDIKSEPFLSSLILNLSISKILDLKHKGKILDQYSAVLIGVIDETNSLEEGEVFVQIKREGSHKGTDECFVLDRNLIVTKNPCLHPGDIKLLKACNKYKKLSHMINVIVFSAKGKRPIQNEISGGDLDGDSYFVSWNENLINNLKKRNVKPQEETKGMGQVNRLKDIKMKDIVNSYIEYMKNDTIALISNMHTAFADNDLVNGAYNEKCMKLAELFSIAIDAPKHGNFVRLEEFKLNGLVLKQYPDFLENPTFPPYESPGVIGQVYRLVNEYEYLEQFEYNEYKYNYLEDYIIDINYISENVHKFAVKAYGIYVNYMNEIKTLMNNCKVTSETELFLAENLHDKKRSKQSKQSDPYTEYKALRDNYRNKIMNAFAANNDSELNLDAASAIYLVTYLNDKSLQKYYHYLMPKCKDVINIMIKDRRISGLESDDYEYYKSNRKSYKEYKCFIENKKEYKGFSDIINQKRIFSLPWLIKEVRDKLFRHGNKNHYY